jgi:hypothetical protein
MTRTGHQHLPDGTLLRIDIENGRYVGRRYDVNLHVLREVIGSHEHVIHEIGGWK